MLKVIPYNNGNGGNQGLDMQNPYWIVNRNRFENTRDRYMANVTLQYDVLDWLNLQGRVRLDNANTEVNQKNYASTDLLFSGEEGRYKRAEESDKQIYTDFLVNINKYWGDFSLMTNVGVSISDIRSSEIGVDGFLIIPNFFALTNVDCSASKTSLIHNEWHEQTQSIFANVELGWKSMVYLSLTGRNDWASALVNTNNSSFFYPSIGLSGVISEMIELPSEISYLKARASYSSVGSAIPRNLSIATYEFNKQGGVWSTNNLQTAG